MALSVGEVTTMSLPMASGRFRSVVEGPDGNLYAAVDEGDIHKLRPKN
jgi:aldose sugar dehydrogenase